MKLLIGLLVLLIVLVQAQLWLGRGGLAQSHALADLLSEQQAINQALRQRNQILEAEVLDLKQGLTAVEERARSELGMIKQHEQFYQLVE